LLNTSLLNYLNTSLLSLINSFNLKMCGILAIFSYQGDMDEIRKRALILSKKLRHRGPDWNGIKVSGRNVLCHERLAIVGIDSGAQPLVGGEGDKIVLCVNGEIYNHKKLKEMLTVEYEFKTYSDCEVIIPLYIQFGEDCVKYLDGKFSFTLYDGIKNQYFATRDPIGVTSLYQGWASDGSVWFASEMKALNEDCQKIEPFEPGTVYSSEKGKYRLYNPIWWNPDYLPPAGAPDLQLLREKLEQAVVKRLMCDVPYGVLLSGGLDSSLIASIACRHARKRVEDDEQTEAWWPRLHSFSVGLPGAPDLKFAAEVAKFLGTAHHEYHFTLQEGIDAVHDVIYHLETYDITTIRASTPMYLLSRKIKALGVKMVLSGEGADEVFGGYLYFHQAPNPVEFHKETVQRVKNLHTSDCLRAHKSTLAWGVEARVPLLDKEFLDVAMTIDPEAKFCRDGRIEKHVLRSAFDTKENPYLPDSILWRQKEQFSDGVGYSWIDTLREYATSQVTDAQFGAAAITYSFNTPATKEAYYYRSIFHTLFPQPTCALTVMKWIPRSDWGCSSDPSGRAQKVHTQSYLNKREQTNGSTQEQENQSKKQKI